LESKGRDDLALTRCQLSLAALAGAVPSSLMRTTTVVVAVFMPAGMLHEPMVIFVGPWFGVAVMIESFRMFPGLDLGTPTWWIILSLLTAAALVIAARWTAATILTTLFFLVNALFLYAFLSADLGHA
jgi:hypothetical protein